MTRSRRPRPHPPTAPEPAVSAVALGWLPMAWALLTLLLTAAACAVTPDAPTPPADPAAPSSPAAAFTVSAHRESVTLHFDPRPAGPVRVTARAVYEADDQPGVVLHDGPVDGDSLRLPRETAGRDLLLHRFHVQNPDTPTPADITTPAAQWVTDVSALPDATRPLPWPDSIKGVSNPEDVADLVALGVRHVHINLSLNQAILPADRPDPGPAYTVAVGDQTLRLDPRTIAAWDRQIAALTEADINVVAVILNQLPDRRGPDFPLVHPDTDLEAAPFRLGAFNLENPRSIAAFVGGLRFIARRYTQPDAPHGRLGGLIIGNEVDSHWTWHNLGPAPLDRVADHYHRELRLAWLAARQAHPDLRVYASLTHSWSRPNSRDPDKNCAGKDLLDRLHALGVAGGDFGWDLAYHPYPQNLFEPRFWNDRLAMFGYDTPMITFKNIELLPAYLDRPGWHYQGQRRSIILSEQGLHTPAGKDGQRVQAAAYALAFHRIQRAGGIDAFILHRHVDAAGEGGLLLGVRGLPPTDGSAAMGPKKASWHAFQTAGGDAGWRSQLTDLLAVADYQSWEQADPRPGPFPDRAPEWDQVQQRDAVAVDLLGRLSEAKIHDALQVADRVVGLADGGMSEGVMLHPDGGEVPAARLVYRLELPEEAADLVFATQRPKTRGDGVAFRVRIDGRPIFDQTVTNVAIRDHRVDLSAFRGQSVELTLEVDRLGDNNYDEAIWLNPAIVLRPVAGPTD